MAIISKIKALLCVSACISCNSNVNPIKQFGSQPNQSLFCLVEAPDNSTCNANKILSLIKNDYRLSQDFGSSQCKITIFTGASLESQKLYVEFDASKHIRAAIGGGDLKWYAFEPKIETDTAFSICRIDDQL